jgi:hypothetical protein
LSLTISIDVPDLTEESAHAIARAAELDGAPFTAAWNGGGMLNRRSGRWHVVMPFLTEHAPEHRFSFHAGWPEHAVHKRLAVSLDSLLELVHAGQLRADLS